ncbi:MAG: NCS2 family permease, partial [Acidobacteria bacterium]|nr:NCS2 family permease [Acidobacteriota bacterium]
MALPLARWFRFDEHGTGYRQEITGGVTTFVTMAYIVVVNPAILANAGIPTGPSTLATILTAALGTILMGLAANRPIAVAPYMGENAFIAFGMATLGIGWQLRIGAVFVSGALFLLIALSGLFRWLADSISPSMKRAFAVGIGLFLSFIGLVETGIVRSGKAVPVEIGDLSSGPVLLSLAGLVIIAVLMARRVRGSILVGIAVVAAAGMLL